MNDPLAWINEELCRLDQQHLRRSRVSRSGLPTVRIARCGRELLNFSSNDYLGLAGDSRLAEAVRSAVRQFGWGATSSPLISGFSELHQDLESDLARFEETESAVVFPTGFAANVGAITGLAGRGDTIFSDARNHASIIDGCRLSGAATIVYEHLSVSDLRFKLRQSRSAGRRLIVTDGLFSMDGDVAPLEEIAALAEQEGAMLLVDEAHATGVLGPRGQGTSELSGIKASAGLVRVGTFSKALGSLGGFVAGTATLTDWLVNRSRPYIFSTAAPPAVLAASQAALRIVREEPQRRHHLLGIAESLRGGLQSAGFDLGTASTQIIPVRIGDPDQTMRLAAWLQEHGHFVPGIRPPSVPPGESLLRISLTCLHTQAMTSQLVEALVEAFQACGVPRQQDSPSGG